jgi:uncharacterized membrane protein YecN with MAPEG domain
MIDAFPVTAAVTLVALTLYLAFGFQVARARGRYNVPAPAIDGPPEFLRVFRVHQNTLEQIAAFLPALWLAAAAIGDPWAGLIGLLWLIGRVVYALGYGQAAEKRIVGFAVTLTSTMALLVATVIGWIVAMV